MSYVHRFLFLVLCKEIIFILVAINILNQENTREVFKMKILNFEENSNELVGIQDKMSTWTIKIPNSIHHIFVRTSAIPIYSNVHLYAILVTTRIISINVYDIASKTNNCSNLLSLIPNVKIRHLPMTKIDTKKTKIVYVNMVRIIYILIIVIMMRLSHDCNKLSIVYLRNNYYRDCKISILLTTKSIFDIISVFIVFVFCIVIYHDGYKIGDFTTIIFSVTVLFQILIFQTNISSNGSGRLNRIIDTRWLDISSVTSML